MFIVYLKETSPMPEQKVLWLPEFLRDNRPARVGLGVLVPSQIELDADSYLLEWKEKFRELLKPKKGRDIPAALSLLNVEWLWSPNDPDHDDLIGEVRLHPETSGLSGLLAYLRDPSPENRDNLLERYPQDPQNDRLSPKEQVKEQESLELDEFLLSL
jgi:hypothetical protein